MTIKRAANGRDAALGICVGGTSPTYQMGQPGLEARTVASPVDIITAAVGAAGTMTGEFQFAYAFVVDGFETGISPWSLTVTLTADKASLSDIAVCADDRCEERRLYFRYRASSSVAWGTPTWCGGVYDNVTTTATVDIAGDSSYLRSDRKPQGMNVAAPITVALASPAAPGNIDDGAHEWCVAPVTALGTGAPGPIASLSIADKSVNGQAVITLPTPTSDITNWKVFRTEAGQTGHANMKLVGTTASSNATYTDNVADSGLGAAAVLADAANVHELSGNYMVPFIRWDTVDYSADYTMAQPAEMARGEGKPAGVPDDVKVSGSLNKALRVSELALMLCGQLGAPTVTSPASGVFKMVWDSRNARDSMRALDFWWYNGATVAEMGGDWFWRNVVSQCSINFQKALASATFTLAGAGHSLCGVAEFSTGGASYKGVISCRNVRADANADTLTLKMKVTTAPSGGTFKVKFDTQSVPTWAGSEYTISYDTSNGKVIPGTRCISDYYEAFDEDGNALGFDDEENRLPFELFFGGDVRDLDLNAVCEFPLLAQVAGTGTGMTGFPRRFLGGGRLTTANAFVYLNSGIVEATAAQIALITNKSPYAALGHEARNIVDFDEAGDYEVNVTLTRRFKDRTFEKLVQRNESFALRLLLDGPPIQSAPGTFTGYRESADIEIASAKVKDTKVGSKGAGPQDETINIVGVDPDSDTEAFVKVTIYSSETFPIPA